MATKQQEACPFQVGDAVTHRGDPCIVELVGLLGDKVFVVQVGESRVHARWAKVHTVTRR